jgi:hypothetical protein
MPDQIRHDGQKEGDFLNCDTVSKAGMTKRYFAKSNQKRLINISGAQPYTLT